VTRRPPRRTGRGEVFRLAALLTAGALCWAAPDRVGQAAHDAGTAVGTLAAAAAEAAGPALAALADRLGQELAERVMPDTGSGTAEQGP
jgi:hypothetical protein